MQFLIPILLLLTCFPGIFAQNNTRANQQPAKDLMQRLEWIEKENNKLVKQLRYRDSLRYTEIRGEIIHAYSVLPKLQYDFHNTADKMAVTSLFTKLLQANNPTSDILGFRFCDVIFSMCEKHFLGKIRNEKERKRFGQVIRKVIDNPIFTTLAGSTPVTSIIGSVISVIASFTSPSLEISREGNRVRNVEINQHDVFNQEDIDRFKEELQVFIDFYESLADASEQYLIGLEDLSHRYEGILAKIMGCKFSLNISECKSCLFPDTSLNRLLPDPRHENLDFTRYLYDPAISRAYGEALKLSELEVSVREFKAEYHQLLIKYLNRFMETLQDTQNFPGEIVSNERLNALIKDISGYISDQTE